MLATAITNPVFNSFQVKPSNNPLVSCNLKVGFWNEWQISAAMKISSFERLTSNWDSYGSPAISRAVFVAAINFLGLISIDDLPAPQIVAVSGGGIQITWMKGDRELQVYVDPNGTLELLKVERGEPLSEGEQVPPITQYVEPHVAWLHAG